MSSDLQTAIDVWSHPGFQTGFVAGLAGLAVILAIALILRRRVYGWGLVFVIAVVVALTIRTEIESDILLRLTVLAATGFLVDLVADRRWRRRWISIAGAWTVTVVAAVWFGVGFGIDEPLWVSYGLPLAVVGLGAGLWAWGRLPETSIVGPLVAISIAGAWVTIPETDLFVVLLGAALPMGLITLWPLSGRPSAAGALALAGVFAWLVLDGGTPRPWTIVASWAGVAAIPLIAGLLHRGMGRLGRVLTVLIHFVYVAIISRVADYTASPLVVVGWSAVALVATGLSVVFLLRRRLAGLGGGDL